MIKYRTLDDHDFSKDRVKIKLWGWTKGGTFELERKRDKIPLNLLIEAN